MNFCKWFNNCSKRSNNIDNMVEGYLYHKERAKDLRAELVEVLSIGTIDTANYKVSKRISPNKRSVTVTDVEKYIPVDYHKYIIKNKQGSGYLLTIKEL